MANLACGATRMLSTNTFTCSRLKAGLLPSRPTTFQSWSSLSTMKFPGIDYWKPLTCCLQLAEVNQNSTSFVSRMAILLEVSLQLGAKNKVCRELIWTAFWAPAHRALADVGLNRTAICRFAASEKQSNVHPPSSLSSTLQKKRLDMRALSFKLLT